MSEAVTTPAPASAQVAATPEAISQPESTVEQSQAPAKTDEEPPAEKAVPAIAHDAKPTAVPETAVDSTSSGQAEASAALKAPEAPTSSTNQPQPAQPVPEPTATTTGDSKPEHTPVVPTAAPELTPAPTSSVKAEDTTAAPTAAPVPEATPIPTQTADSAPEVTTTSETTPEMTAAKAEPTQTPVVPTTTEATLPSDAPLAGEKEPKEELEEPQSPLTRLFTEAEWTALKEFRGDLPNILAEAFPDRKEANTTPVTLWGVSLDPNGTKDARASVVLMKFLRARNLNPSAARDMLVSTLRWRESFSIEAALKEEFPEDVFGPLAHISGVDKENRPVVYNLYGANPDIKSVFSDVQRFIRWRVALQERSVLLLDFTEVDQMIQIHDYEGVGLTSRDANSKAAASEATNIFQNHYPEMLHKKFFINVPTLLNWIFWAFKPLIPAATLAKMTVVGSGQSAIKKALLPHIEDHELPQRYGGAAEAF